jgi:hypothetical protein
MEIFRKQKGNFSIAAFSNGLVSYGRNAKNKYRIELTVFDTPIAIYSSIRKPIFRNINIIRILAIPLLTISAPLIIIGLLIYIYFEGAVNFIRHSANATCVRSFNWSNIILIAILVVLLILK